jgi:ureidoacrylate peracid hydrolase
MWTCARPAAAQRTITIDATPQRLTMDLGRTAVIVVDMQNDFCAPGGWLASIGVDISPARAAIPAIAALLPPLRAAGVPVIWLNWGNRPDRANLPPNVLHVYDPAGEGAASHPVQRPPVLRVHRPGRRHRGCRSPVR